MTFYVKGIDVDGEIFTIEIKAKGSVDAANKVSNLPGIKEILEISESPL